MSLNDTAAKLIDLAFHDNDADEEIPSQAQQLVQQSRSATAQAVQDCLDQLGGYFEHDDQSRAAYIALVCGAIVENGHDPAAIITPITKKIENLLSQSVAFCERCIDYMPDELDEDADEYDVFEGVVTQQAKAVPELYSAWRLLDEFWQPAIAVYSASKSARKQARVLRGLAYEIANWHQGAYWLEMIFSILDDEPLLVIEPDTETGILANISGVVDNFQLHMLLMDKMPQNNPRDPARIPRDIAAVAYGSGPQKTDAHVNGAWNLYTFAAVGSDPVLPEANNSNYWIWNEGRPEDIPVFNGRRAILLGPSAYARSWSAQRIFAALPAEFVIEKELTKIEIKELLQAMRSTNQ